MRYLLLMHYAEPAPGTSPRRPSRRPRRRSAPTDGPSRRPGCSSPPRCSPPTASTTTLTLRRGSLEVQDGPFAETKEALAGVFVVDVPDLDAALGWAEKCPGAQYGVIEVRPCATSLIDGAWTAAAACDRASRRRAPHPRDGRAGAGRARGPHQLRPAARPPRGRARTTSPAPRTPSPTPSNARCAPGPSTASPTDPRPGCSPSPATGSATRGARPRPPARRHSTPTPTRRCTSTRSTRMPSPTAGSS